MATMSDVSIINWNKAEAKPVASGLERTICSQALCGSKTLTVYQRTVQEGRQLDVQAGGDYHLVYVIEAKAGTISFNGKSHAAEDGAGALLGEFETGAGDSQVNVAASTRTSSKRNTEQFWSIIKPSENHQPSVKTILRVNSYGA